MSARPGAVVAVYLALLAALSGGVVAAMLLAGEQAGHLAQGYMLLPAVAALVVWAGPGRRRLARPGWRPCRWRDLATAWLASLAISAAVFAAYTVAGIGRWDPTGQAFIARLEAQLAAVGQDLATATPPGMTPQAMVWLFALGGLTVFNVLPGLVTGLGEEVGWRGLVFPQLSRIRVWVGIVVGGLLWFAWHLPLLLVVPQTGDAGPAWLLLPLLALGSICTHTYLAYVYVRSRSILAAALAHITLNNAQASFAYFFVVEDLWTANVALVVVMALVVAGLAVTGRLGVFTSVVEPAPAAQGEERKP